MTLDAILYILTHSTADDWYRIPCGSHDCGPSYYYRIESAGMDGNEAYLTGTHTSVATYRQDVSITMAWGMTAGKGCERHEPWASSFPDPRPDKCYLLDLFYSGSLVFRTTYCATADGSRLPLADAGLRVPRRYADVIRKLNELEGDRGFEDTLKKSGTTVIDVPWPV